jgi:hypothetical protein
VPILLTSIEKTTCAYQMLPTQLVAEWLPNPKKARHMSSTALCFACAALHTFQPLYFLNVPPCDKPAVMQPLPKALLSVHERMLVPIAHVSLPVQGMRSCSLKVLPA